MPKRVFQFCYLSVTFIFLLVSCEKEETDHYHFDLHFITENLEPFNFESGGQITGLAPDLLKEIARGLNIPFDVDILPWEEGYTMLQNSDNAVLFSMALNAERIDLFKWAGPFAALEWRFYTSSQNHWVINSMDNARDVEAIGVLYDYAVTQHLESLGFTNLVYFDTHEEAFQHLLDGDIDLYPSDVFSAKSALENLGYLYYNVRSVWPIKTDLLYFAFNKNVPDDVVADFQSEIDKLKSSGYLQQLSQQYLNTSDYPGTLQIYTEDYLPLTFMNSFGEISGFGADIVFEIMDRTPIREHLFQWVGPIGTNDTYFYLKQGSEITINSIEDAMNLDAIATVSSWFSDQYLRELGFTNLVAFDEPGAGVDELMSGNVDAFVCSAITISDILLANGYAFSDVAPEFVLMSSDFYISFSKNTDEATVDQWQQAFDAMQADGTYDAIYERWFQE